MFKIIVNFVNTIALETFSLQGCLKWLWIYIIVMHTNRDLIIKLIIFFGGWSSRGVLSNLQDCDMVVSDLGTFVVILRSLSN